MAAGAELLIPMAVHTAKYGYDWSNVPAGMTRADLDGWYRAVIAQRPEFMEIGDVVAGVFARGGRVAAFCLQIARDWDANGRNAEYGAFAFVSSYAEAAKVDFGALLARDDFRVPTRNPPTAIAYGGPVSAPAEAPRALDAVRALCRGETVDDFDFGMIGAVLAAFGVMRGSWRFCTVRTSHGRRTQATALPTDPDLAPPVRSVPWARPQGSPPAADPPSAPVARREAGADWLGLLTWLVSIAAVGVALYAAFKG